MRIADSHKLIIKFYGQTIIGITLIPWLLTIVDVDDKLSFRFSSCCHVTQIKYTKDANKSGWHVMYLGCMLKVACPLGHVSVNTIQLL